MKKKGDQTPESLVTQNQYDKGDKAIKENNGDVRGQNAMGLKANGGTGRIQQNRNNGETKLRERTLKRHCCNITTIEQDKRENRTKGATQGQVRH